MQRYTANTTKPDRYAIFQERSQRIADWAQSPFTARGEAVSAAVIGALTFIMFVIAAGF